MAWRHQLDQVTMRRGNRVILDQVTLTVLSGAKIGVVGPNGSGKSSILRLLAGLDQPSAGTVVPPPGVSIGILLQDPPLDDTTTVLGNVQQGAQETRTLLAHYAELTEALAGSATDDDLAELGELQLLLDQVNAWDLDSRLAQAMDALRCPPPHVDVLSLSGGERRRVALCALLVRQPELLLLDEPTNNLDADSVAWLEEHLVSYPGTVVAVTHDRYFLDNVAEWILELDRGHAYPYSGNYSTYLETKQARLSVEGKRDAKLKKRLQQELDWARSSATARQASTRARLARYEQMADEAAKTRTLDFDEIQIPPGPRLGSQVLEAADVCKGYGSRELIKDLSFSLPRNGIVGILGPNGVGKTTLFQMLAGRERPDSGEIAIGDTVRVAYADQSRGGMAPEKTAWELISDRQDYITVGQMEVPARAYLAAFGFKGASQQKAVRQFSGGEQNRLNLALTLKQGGNVLLLDEPTNDLDTETLASLETALLDFSGCVLVTAHDRWFLDRVATHILAWEGTETDPAAWFWFEGNFADYERNKAGRLGIDQATSSERGSHRRLSRR